MSLITLLLALESFDAFLQLVPKRCNLLPVNIARQDHFVSWVCRAAAEFHRLNLVHLDLLANKSLFSSNRSVGLVCSFACGIIFGTLHKPKRALRSRHVCWIS